MGLGQVGWGAYGIRLRIQFLPDFIIEQRMLTTADMVKIGSTEGTLLLDYQKEHL